MTYHTTKIWEIHPHITSLSLFSTIFQLLTKMYCHEWMDQITILGGNTRFEIFASPQFVFWNLKLVDRLTMYTKAILVDNLAVVAILVDNLAIVKF